VIPAVTDPEWLAGNSSTAPFTQNTSLPPFFFNHLFPSEHLWSRKGKVDTVSFREMLG